MKLEDKSEDNWTNGFMFGLILLGPAVGKLKYTLLDKEDITRLQNHVFEPYVEIDRNGQGAQVFAYTYNINKGKKHGSFVHDLLWEMHFGGIAPGFRVMHKNGITMDNRLLNLSLCSVKNSHYYCLKSNGPSLYRTAIEEMPHEVEPIYMELFSPQEEIFLSKNERFFECHYPSCTTIEKWPQEFSVCSMCRVTRYCSSSCQTKDWQWHKPTCIQKPRPIVKEEIDR